MTEQDIKNIVEKIKTEEQEEDLFCFDEVKHQEPVEQKITETVKTEFDKSLEKFIEEHLEELPCKYYMGVGGSFDVFAGNVKRAPKWMIKLGLEWLYRVSKQPWRIKRLGAIPKFLWKVIRKDSKVRSDA